MNSIFKEYSKKFKTEKGIHLAYLLNVAKKQDFNRCGIVFLSGFRSDMRGTKAEYLSELCKKEDRFFLRLDYSGHGESEGDFSDLCLSDWINDAKTLIKEFTQKQKIILIGSSMGGWIGLRIAAEFKNIVGFIGLAAAPDFTRDMTNDRMTLQQKQELEANGFIKMDCDYDPNEAYIITKKLIEDGENHILLDKDINLNIPIHLLQGMQDTDVQWQMAHKICEKMTSNNVKITFIKDGDHRLSRDQDLQTLKNTIHSMYEMIEVE